MKEPIKPKGIRKGDLIRYEFRDSDTATEYRAQTDEDAWYAGTERYYLLDRPKSYEERAAWHLASTLAMIRKRETGGTSWYNVDHALEAIESLREWEAKNVQ